MRLKPRFQLAKNLADELINRFQLVEPPIPVPVIAEKLGMEVRYEPLDGDVSGMARRQPNGRIVIGINTSQGWERQRFTCAHELGHALMHGDKSFHLDRLGNIGFGTIIGLRTPVSSEASDSQEIEANVFAANLLMPERFIIDDLTTRAGWEMDEIVQDLAARYDVSQAAMTIRVTKYEQFMAH